MNIVVCVKYVPDAQADRTFKEIDKTTDRENVDGLLSELDEYAIEEALKLVEAGEGEVTVVTVGPDQAPTPSRRPCRWAPTRACTWTTPIHGSDALATSLVLAEAIEKLSAKASPTSSSPAWRRPTAPWASSRRCSPSGSACPR